MKNKNLQGPRLLDGYFKKLKIWKPNFICIFFSIKCFSVYASEFQTVLFLFFSPMSHEQLPYVKKNKTVFTSKIKAEKQQGAKCETSVQHQILHRNQRTVFTKADKTELRLTYLFSVGLFCFFFFFFCETLCRLSGNPFSHSV